MASNYLNKYILITRVKKEEKKKRKEKMSSAIFGTGVYFQIFGKFHYGNVSVFVR